MPLSFDLPLLAVEASTAAGAVTLWRGGRVVGDEAVAMGAGRDDRLFPAIQRLLQSANLSPNALGAVVCGAGPGSFTSLRIAASLAKGLAHGARCPLFAVPSLLVAGATAFGHTGPDRFVVHADALRGERYVQPLERTAEGGIRIAGPLARVPLMQLQADVSPAHRVAVLSSPLEDDVHVVVPGLTLLSAAVGAWREAPVELDAWEPVYGRLAEAQVKWEEQHGIGLPSTPLVRS